MAGFTQWRHLVGFETRQRTVFDVAHRTPVLGGLFLADQAGHTVYFRHDDWWIVVDGIRGAGGSPD